MICLFRFKNSLRSGKAKFSAQDHLTITEANIPTVTAPHVCLMEGEHIQLSFVYTTLCVSVCLGKEEQVQFE